MAIIEHAGLKPVIDETASVSCGAIVSGDVTIGPHAVVLAGAVITSEGAPVRIGRRCVIMEHAVLRGAGVHPCTLADHVLVAPRVHISGATIERCCFIADAAVVLNGAVLEVGCVVDIRGVIHIGTRCPAGMYIPIDHLAVGSPATIYTPAQAAAGRERDGFKAFAKAVFGIEAAPLSQTDAIRAVCDRYSTALAQHREDRLANS